MKFRSLISLDSARVPPLGGDDSGVVVDGPDLIHRDTLCQAYSIWVTSPECRAPSQPEKAQTSSDHQQKAMPHGPEIQRRGIHRVVAVVAK